MLLLGLALPVWLVAALAVPAAPVHASPQSSATPQGSAAGPQCAWRLMAGSRTFNVAFPDTNATYWVMPYALGPGDSIELSGRYPAARYFSLNTYGTDLDTVDTLPDREIRPATGSNPYASTTGTGGTWRARVVNGPADHARNQLRALPTGQRAPVGFLIVRVYVPDDPRSPSGGVPLPTATMHLGGTSVVLPPCATPFDPSEYQGPIASGLRSAFDSALARAATGSFPANAPEAVFANPARTGGLFPNGDNAYIGASLTYRPGRVAVIRGKAPTFPDTRAGVSPATPGMAVRYWAMCQNDKVPPYPVVDCAADFQTPLDGDGYYTYVVATPAEARQLRGRGLKILDWGATDVPKVVLLRNMLPSSSFAESIQRAQRSGTGLAASMGDYYPRATYCDVGVLAAQGYSAC